MSISLEWWTGLKVSSREAKVRPFNSDGMNDERSGRWVELFVHVSFVSFTRIFTECCSRIRANAASAVFARVCCCVRVSAW